MCTLALCLLYFLVFILVKYDAQLSFFGDGSYGLGVSGLYYFPHMSSSEVNSASYPQQDGKIE